MDEQSKKNLTEDARGLAKWFSVDIEIKIFGNLIWKYHFPPKSK